jgi:hypothetical protein
LTTINFSCFSSAERLPFILLITPQMRNSTKLKCIASGLLLISSCAVCRSGAPSHRPPFGLQLLCPLPASSSNPSSHQKLSAEVGVLQLLNTVLLIICSCSQGSPTHFTSLTAAEGNELSFASNAVRVRQWLLYALWLLCSLFLIRFN